MISTGVASFVVKDCVNWWRYLSCTVTDTAAGHDKYDNWEVGEVKVLVKTVAVQISSKQQWTAGSAKVTTGSAKNLPI